MCKSFINEKMRTHTHTFGPELNATQAQRLNCAQKMYRRSILTHVLICFCSHRILSHIIVVVVVFCVYFKPKRVPIEGIFILISLRKRLNCQRYHSETETMLECCMMNVLDEYESHTNSSFIYIENCSGWKYSFYCSRSAWWVCE